MSLEDIARSHLADALAGTMQHCVVSEWLDGGEPVKVYWKPLTGIEQQRIEAFDDNVKKICMTVKVRARDAGGNLIFDNVPIESMMRDFDYSVLRAIAFLMVADFGDTEETIEDIEKE